MQGYYQVRNISAANESLLMNGVFIVLIHAAQIPPHLAVSVNGRSFSLSVNGQHVNNDLRSLIRKARTQNIEMLFVQLDRVDNTNEELEEKIAHCVSAYPRVKEGIATCLAPIKDFCRSVYGIDTNGVNFIYDLLPQLSERNIIKSNYHLNLDNYLKDDSFFLSRYTMDDINGEIRRRTELAKTGNRF